MAVEDLPPLPSTSDEIRRVNHTRQRRRLLYGQHERDLTELLRAQLGGVRAEAWGKPDLTANPYLSLWSQISVLYNAEPHVIAPEGSEGLAEAVAEAGYWPLAQRMQRDTLGLREMLVRVDCDPVDGLSFRLVFPDMVEAIAHPRRPHVPVRIREWMQHARLGWVCHDLSIEDPEAPFYRVEDTSGKDITPDVLGADHTGGWPDDYRDSEGRAVLPYVLYHAAQTGCLFDAFTLREIVEASLNLGVLLTYYGHVIRNAAWAQRWGIGVRIRGLSIDHVDGHEPSEGITTDPATIALFDGEQDAPNPQLGTFTNPVDPLIILTSIAMYERRAMLLANVSPPDVTRQDADVRSGYSLAVAREAVREAQAVYEPQFRQGDQTLFRIAACLSNRMLSTSYDETPRAYRFAYQGLPKSPVEEKLEAEMLAAEIASKRIGPVSAYRRRYPGVTHEEAVKRLAEVAVEEEAVKAMTAEMLGDMGVTPGPAPITEQQPAA